MSEINEFILTLSEDVRLLSESNGLSMEEAFFWRISDTITGSGEVDLLEYFHHRGSSQSGIRVDGWGGDPKQSRQLTLFVVNHADAIDAPTLTGTELENLFKRPLRFLEAALDEGWRNRLEETSPGFELSEMIAAKWPAIRKISLLLITDRKLSSRVDGHEMTEFQGRSVSYSVWDINRLAQIETSALGREEIIVDLNQHGGALAVLPAHMPDSPYNAYLAAIPGTVLASIYERWQARLLEQNVRVFLQARGNVNKGIRKTIDEEPTMFFAYNNGITATAEAVEIEHSNGVSTMTTIKNLQIVNGGQTSASIHAASQLGKDLSKTFVQMKLSIVDSHSAEKIVPDISRYANSQNRIAAADFFSNHPFHIRMEEISRRIFAPAKAGQFTQSRWFYERARGQFADRRSKLTSAQRRKFDLEHPRSQLFTKIDLAKAEMTWRLHPEIVSLGAQKNFAHFAHQIGKEWAKKETAFSEEWFRNAVTKLLIFRKTERIVSDAAGSWYTGGLRANTVCYAIAKLVHDLREDRRSIDLQSIWSSQEIPESLVDALDQCAEVMHMHLLTPMIGGSNPTEWAKKKACADAALKFEIDLRSDLSDILVGIEEICMRDAEGKRDQKMINGIQAQVRVVEIGSVGWKALRVWIRDTSMRITPVESGIIEAAIRIRHKPLSEAQAVRAIAVFNRATEGGFTINRQY
ncbi:MAG: AIPR family protein [Aestuariivita sp.]|nr:AIPR family protein [Aestuariivita sp.]